MDIPGEPDYPGSAPPPGTAYITWQSYPYKSPAGRYRDTLGQLDPYPQGTQGCQGYQEYQCISTGPVGATREGAGTVGLPGYPRPQGTGYHHQEP